jgi:outer membrane receptor protein involved in Fe transport
VFEQKWKDFQFAVVGANGLTEIRNANQARIRGFESNLTWAATYNLVLSGGIALIHSELTANYCGLLDDNDQPVTDCSEPLAPKGARLPITPKIKGNLTARYNFQLAGREAYMQGAVFGTGRRRADLRTVQADILGDLPGYGTVDLSAGFKQDQWSFDVYLKNAFDNRGQIANYSECRPEVCGGTTYIIPVQPRTLGIRLTRDF